MGQLFTEEMQAELERWQAIEAEARNPVDCLIPSRPKLSDTLRGFARWFVAAIRYRTVGGWEPLSLRRLARELIGRETEKNYVSAGVERDWTAEEDADFLEFCDTIDVPPSDPELALAMEDGEVDFFNNDVFVGVKLYRA
jgi:hypothetical protein